MEVQGKNHHNIRLVDYRFTKYEAQSVVRMTKRGPKGDEIYHVDIDNYMYLWEMVNI